MQDRGGEKLTRGKEGTKEEREGETSGGEKWKRKELTRIQGNDGEEDVR